MTSPIPPDVKAACRAALPSLLAAHGLDSGAPVVQDDEGWVNPCFFVGDHLVARFNSREPDVPKFAREVVAFGLARRLTVPVPEVVAHDRSRRHAPYEALITRRLPGTSVELSWPDLRGETRAHLARDVGHLMAGLHSIDPGGFGELDAPPEQRTGRLGPRVTEILETRLDEALAAGIFTDEDAERTRRVVARRSPALDAVERPSLVHGDLHLGNVLHVDGELSGVLDFEWSRAGDPVEDLVTVSFLDDMCAGAAAPLRAAYRERRGDEPHERARLELHCVLHNVMMCVVTHRHVPGEAKETLAATRAYLTRLDDR